MIKLKQIELKIFIWNSISVCHLHLDSTWSIR
jgi:hypothetical protein